MQIELTTEQEAQLSQMAALEGKATEDLAREVLARSIAAEANFLDAVRIGQEEADRGDLLEPSAVWAKVEESLRF
jgi:predicted transcriptional regulator